MRPPSDLHRHCMKGEKKSSRLSSGTGCARSLCLSEMSKTKEDMTEQPENAMFARVQL